MTLLCLLHSRRKADGARRSRSLCPFPFPYSNAFFASIESVTLFQFIVATLCTTPKLLLHVWVGQRTFLFADPDSREALDPQAK